MLCVLNKFSRSWFIHEHKWTEQFRFTAICENASLHGLFSMCSNWTLWKWNGCKDLPRRMRWTVNWDVPMAAASADTLVPEFRYTHNETVIFPIWVFVLLVTLGILRRSCESSTYRKDLAYPSEYLMIWLVLVGIFPNKTDLQRVYFL